MATIDFTLPAFLFPADRLCASDRSSVCINLYRSPAARTASTSSTGSWKFGNQFGMIFSLQCGHKFIRQLQCKGSFTLRLGEQLHGNLQPDLVNALAVGMQNFLLGNHTGWAWTEI